MRAAIMNSHYVVTYEQCLSELNSTGNPVEGVSNGLATRVSMPCRVRSPLRWTRDPEASVSNRILTLTLVTLSSYAGSLPIRNGRRFRDQYDHFLPTFLLKKSLLFISYGLEFLGGTRLTVHTG